MTSPIPPLPGDTLLYGKSDFFGVLTSLVTFSPAVHVEKYEGNGMSLASRNGIGVNRYPFRIEQLIAVLRPNQPINMAAVTKWFEQPYNPFTCEGVHGRYYGWWDLLRFRDIKVPTNGWICSQFASMADDAGGLKSFAKDYYRGDLDPGEFFSSAAYDWEWVRPDVRVWLTT
jgi:hypothetical protein